MLIEISKKYLKSNNCSEGKIFISAKPTLLINKKGKKLIIKITLVACGITTFAKSFLFFKVLNTK